MQLQTDKKVTHIQARRDAARNTMHQIMEAIKISEMMYCQVMYDSGLDYLEHYVRTAKDIARFETSRTFWNWWKIQWTLREEEFLPFCLKHESLLLRRVIWENLHNPIQLSQERTPNGIVLGDRWSIMIGQLHKEERIKGASDYLNDAE